MSEERTTISKKSYSKKFKLNFVEHYKTLAIRNVKHHILSETAKHFKMDEINVCRVVKTESKRQKVLSRTVREDNDFARKLKTS